MKSDSISAIASLNIGSPRSKLASQAQPTPSQSEPVAWITDIKRDGDWEFHGITEHKPSMEAMRNDGAIITNLYTKPQPTSQDAERLKYLHAYYSMNGQISNTSYEQWIANIDAIKNDKP